MKKLRLLLILGLFIFFNNSYAQDNQNAQEDAIQYKVTFPNIDQYQLKEMYVFCNDLFQFIPGSLRQKENTLFFSSEAKITSEMMKKELLDKNYTFKFELTTLNDKTETYENK